MALSDFAKKAINQGIAAIKDRLKRVLMPILLKYGIPALLILIIIFAIIGMFTGNKYEADAATDENMESASSDAWEQFARFIATMEGGNQIYKNDKRRRLL